MRKELQALRLARQQLSRPHSPVANSGRNILPSFRIPPVAMATKKKPAPHVDALHLESGLPFTAVKEQMDDEDRAPLEEPKNNPFKKVLQSEQDSKPQRKGKST